ncbi:hypothetical protein [Actibacterium pelagium]|uniref:hypothetical protein n=1 Tax=Actibacterium pelagium TaxID=2029103 RepID=UPI0016655C83|nr:hypothetical protein [Actibacterium pelagium]
MLFKIITFFLIFMAVLAMFGRLRFPKFKKGLLKQGKCRHCGAPKVGKGPCPCGKG